MSAVLLSYQIEINHGNSERREMVALEQIGLATADSDFEVS